MENNFKTLYKKIKCVKKSRIKWLYAELKLIKICFKAMNDINVPVNEKEKERLKEYIDSYDSSIKLIEKDFISSLRSYIS